MHRAPRQIARDPYRAEPPRERRESQEHLVGVKRKDHAPCVALRVVAEERGWRELAPTLDEEIVHHMVNIDEESSHHETRRERDRAGAGEDGAARDRCGDEVPPRAHPAHGRVVRPRVTIG